MIKITDLKGQTLGLNWWILECAKFSAQPPEEKNVQRKTNNCKKKKKHPWKDERVFV